MKEIILFLLGLAVLMAFFFTSHAILMHPPGTLDPQTATLYGQVYGALSMLAGLIVNYYFGTSRSSADKDKTISNMAARDVKPSTPETGETT